jgi:hypothetical protein
MRIMRRSSLVLLSISVLLLLLAQQGAVLHELSHVYYTAQHSGAHLSEDQHQPDTEHCPECRSFAQVGASVCGSDHSLDLVPATQLRVPDRVYSIIGAKAPTARSRGPPEASV